MARVGGQVGQAAPAVRGVLAVPIAALAVGGALVFQAEVLGVEFVRLIVGEHILLMQGIPVKGQCGIPLAEALAALLVGVREVHVLWEGHTFRERGWVEVETGLLFAIDGVDLVPGGARFGLQIGALRLAAVLGVLGGHGPLEVVFGLVVLIVVRLPVARSPARRFRDIGVGYLFRKVPRTLQGVGPVLRGPLVPLGDGVLGQGVLAD